jgi:membrane-associated protease RseP (regulator of RpoE activity)
MTTDRRLLTTTLCISCLLSPALLFGQDLGQQVRNAQLDVEGRVQRVIETDEEPIIQISVQTSSAISNSMSETIRFPAPGTLVYVHVSGWRDSSNRPPRAAFIRASLRQDANGQWTNAGGNWFTQIQPTDIASDKRPNPSAKPKPFGLITEPVFVGGTAGLKVTGVVTNSPAATAGIEDGDVLMKIDGQPLDSTAKLVRAETSNQARVVVTVKDIRTGREVDVAIENQYPPQPGRPNRGMKPLGITGALAFYQGNPAIKVTDVAAGSPASQAGIKKGWLVLKANGKALSQPDELPQVANDSNGTLLLEIFDPRTRETKMVRAVLR